MSTDDSIRDFPKYLPLLPKNNGKIRKHGDNVVKHHANKRKNNRKRRRLYGKS